MYIAQIGAAGELIVIEVLTRSSGRPSSRTSMSARLTDRDAARPELALRLGVVGVVAVQGRHVVGDRQAGLAGGEQLAEAGVRVLRGAEAGEHPHRPQPAAIAGRVDAAGERRLAREADARDRIRRPASDHGPYSGSIGMSLIVEKRGLALRRAIEAGSGAPLPRRRLAVGLGRPVLMGRL